MEKEIDKNAVVLNNDENAGAVQIADDVVGMIAALAATEVPGVSSMAGNITNDFLSRAGMKKLSRCVRVTALNGSVTVDLALIMEYGYNIPAACQKVQGKVKSAIENMTGLKCTDVNIRIAGVKVK